jgi:translocation and assembly module TamB
VQIRDASAEIASGHVTATAAMTLAGGVRLGGVRLDSRAQFTNISLHRLVSAGSAARSLGSGKISGSLTLAGQDVRSLRGLTGTLNAKLRDTHAAGAAVFNSMQSYMPGAFGSVRFASGSLRARLANGVVRVERLSLDSPNLQAYVDGTVSLQGRLKLGVVVNTGKIQTNPSILLLASRLAIFAAPPAALLLQANQFLANQVIYLEVRGTVRSPNVRVRALPQLEEEVVRFFLLQSPVPATPGSS